VQKKVVTGFEMNVKDFKGKIYGKHLMYVCTLCSQQPVGGQESKPELEALPPVLPPRFGDNVPAVAVHCFCRLLQHSKERGFERLLKHLIDAPSQCLESVTQLLEAKSSTTPLGAAFSQECMRILLEKPISGLCCLSKESIFSSLFPCSECSTIICFKRRKQTTSRYTMCSILHTQ
jgi:hypothetical protein